MKSMKRLLCFLMLCLIFGCKEEGRVDFIDENAPAPKSVEVVEVVNTLGGAIIRFKLPEDNNLLGVKAVYNRNGETVETKASLYVDTLSIEGFGNDLPQDIQLFSIGKNEKLSDPVSVQIKPLSPPVQTVQFDLEAGFGGVIVSIDSNRTNADLAIVLLADTLATGSYAEMQTFHTKAQNIKLPRRGLKIEPTRFGAYLRDRWNNVSDTIYKELLPVEELKIPNDLFRNAALPTDYFETAEGNNAYRLEQLWLGEDGSDNQFYASSHSGPLPQWFTIDFGRRVKLSRIQKWPRPDHELYSSTGPRMFEVWGSDNPNPDGTWDDSWFLIGEFEQFKPSGYGEGREVGPITDEDHDYWYNRTEFDIMPTEKAPDPYRPITHVRVKILSTFQTYGTETNRSQVIIGQFAFWGQLED